MDKKSICNILFTCEKGKWRMWLVKFMAINGIKLYDVLLTGDKKIPADDADETKYKGFTELNFLDKTSYNEIVITQEYTVYFSYH